MVFPSKPGVKRPRGEDVSVSDFWADPTGSYLKVTLKSGEKVKSKGYPWVQAALRSVLGKEKAEKANFLQDGSLLVKTKNESQTEKLLQISSLLQEECLIVRDERLNVSKGTIHATDLLDLSEGEIVQWLSEFGVVGAKRLTKKEGGQVVATPLILLTFGVPTCPQRLRLDYVTYHVKRHIPNPLMCFQCGRFGHHQDRCVGEKKCLNCGERAHEGECNPKCINCQKPGHTCRAYECPVWRKEKDICTMKVENDISYAEARRKYDDAHKLPTPSVQSFADAVRVPSVGEQIRQGEGISKEKYEKLEKKIDHLTDLVFQLTKHISERDATPEPQDESGNEDEGELPENPKQTKVSAGSSDLTPANDAPKGKVLPKTVPFKLVKSKKARGKPPREPNPDTDHDADFAMTDDEQSQAHAKRSVSRERGPLQGQKQAWQNV